MNASNIPSSIPGATVQHRLIRHGQPLNYLRMTMHELRFEVDRLHDALERAGTAGGPVYEYLLVKYILRTRADLARQRIG
ncbi:hypothetical protein PTW37_15055 [Arthrobacter agilis]|uniref:hypothetical protein n=1 Tax=Arthrobacter agilis TaxID=37921 RepID=UPI002367235F|nr:hypothetical protein [Arthrobacter agilis]WDF33146.1 hypothetical protein PTW37_15055 [Arthrobacter agilis]